MKQFIFLLLTTIIVIIAVIFDIYLIIDVVKSIINDTKTTLQLTFEIFSILIVVPLCTRILIYVIYWILRLFK
jgi:hypothetical protein|nr:MAG TPA: hypothetical protein [Caudoviricetes sp.]